MGINLNEMPKLGFGLMRLPEKDGAIDLQQVNSMVDHYMKMEKHYFDTAYVYHGGNSEVAAREALVRRYPRDSVRTCVRQIRTAFARPHLRLTDQSFFPSSKSQDSCQSVRTAHGRTVHSGPDPAGY